MRTKAYEAAIDGCKKLFADKIVMDVGAGSGLWIFKLKDGQ